MLNNKLALDKNNMHYEDIWRNVTKDLNKHYGEALYRSWFSKIRFLEFSGNSILLATPTNFIRDWIKSNYSSFILELWQHYDKEVKSIEMITKKPTEEIKIVADNSISAQDANNNGVFSSLDPRFTFDNFVVGTPNELAYAAARAVDESKTAGAESNPLFLYGGVGLGKTHLMHAIAWYIKNHNPTRKVIYMSAEKFMYQFIKALRDKDVMSFKDEFRSVDVLMIDDIQFICGKDSTQEEFFHTFNAIIDNNRQMVISCDRSPSDLDNIEERIKSRLGWGLVADVHSTTYELRLGILQSKLEQMSIQIPQNVVEFLGAKITSNVRELEGALNKVIAHSTLVNREISLENTQDILRDLLRSNERIITIEDIQKKVAERYNVKLSDMSSTRRLRSVARPRQVAMYLAKILTPKSLADIGKKFGKKDHTTVMHAIKRVEELCGSDQEFNEELRLLTRILQT
jgi:chromosomal replication initiator protein